MIDKNPSTRSVSALILCLALCLSCSNGTEQVTQKEVVRPVKLFTVTTDVGGQVTNYPAVVEASQLAEISFPTGGVLKALKVTEAQKVQEGQIIAELDTRDFVNNLTQAQASLENAEQDYQRALRLQKENAIAVNIVEQRKSQRQVAKAQFDSAQKALSDAVMKAPFSGVIASVSAQEATTVGGGQAIVTLMGDGGFEVAVDLPADFIAKTRTRTQGKSVLRLNAASDKEIPVSFKEASLLADASSQTYKVRFSFSPPDDLVILPGMNGTLELTSVASGSETVDTVVVPLSSISSDGQNHFVWAIDQDTMIASKRAVTIRPGIGETVVITEGLAVGETIAGAGASYLAEGMKVRRWATTNSQLETP